MERWNFEDRPAILHGAGVSTLKRRKRNFKQHAGGYNAQWCAFPFGKPLFNRFDEYLVKLFKQRSGVGLRSRKSSVEVPRYTDCGMELRNNLAQSVDTTDAIEIELGELNHVARQNPDIKIPVDAEGEFNHRRT